MIGREVGNFRIVRELGRGGMGTVFEGLDLMLDRRVAIKVLNVELANDTQFVARFRKEAKALARLDHPNVTAIYSFFAEGNELFLVMELVEGEPLDEIQKRRGKLSWPEAVPITCALLDGLAHAHQQGIIHRDIKPGNCLLSHGGVVKVTDFGIAHIVGEQRLTRLGSIIGTVEYMSPEQIQGEELDPRSDVYSLGLVLYELLTGRVPFPGGSEFEVMRAQLEAVPEPPSKLAEGLPAWLESATLRALAKRPAERFQSAIEFASALRDGLEASGIGRTEAASVGIPVPVVPPPVPGSASRDVTWPVGARPDAPTLETAPTIESRPEVPRLPDVTPTSATPPAAEAPVVAASPPVFPSTVAPSAVTPPVVAPQAMTPAQGVQAIAYAGPTDASVAVPPAPPPVAVVSAGLEPPPSKPSKIIPWVTLGLLVTALLIVGVALMRPGQGSEPPQQLAEVSDGTMPQSVDASAGPADPQPGSATMATPQPRPTMSASGSTSEPSGLGAPTPSSPGATEPRAGASPVESRSGETRSGETRSGETRSGESRSGESRSGATRSGQIRSEETRSDESRRAALSGSNTPASEQTTEAPVREPSGSSSSHEPSESSGLSDTTPLPEPAASGDPLDSLDPLAEELQFNCNLLLESFEELLDAREPPDGSPAWDLATRFEVLEEATNRLQRAYDQIADKEGGGGIKRRRTFRKIKARAGRLVSGADRQKVWTRAEQAVSAGKRIKELVPQVELDSATRTLWGKVRGQLDRLERLVHQAR